MTVLVLKIILVTFAFNALDFFSGFIGAWIAKNLSSTKLREGAIHKLTFVLLIVFAILCDYGQNLIDLGIPFSLVVPVCIYIITTEITSIFENLCIMNPKLAQSKIANYFIKVKVIENETKQ